MKITERIKTISNLPQTRLSLNQIRVVVALERAVARFETSPKLKDHLIFKGGFVLLKTIESPRFTRDLDVLAFGIQQDKAAALAQEALSKDLKDDLWFLDIQTRDIPDQGEYGGLRLNCAFHIGASAPDSKHIKKLSRVHIDIAFGDMLPFKSIKTTEMHSVLESQSETWKIYPLEFIFAEKLQTLIARGSANSRAKDIYDLVELYPKCNLKTLSNCITDVFKNRDTDLPADLSDAINAIDPALLHHSWGSVDLPGTQVDFQIYWDRLVKIVAALSKGLGDL